MSYCFFFFKQKTAYEMRISDWSSDVCSSDLRPTPSIAGATTKDSINKVKLLGWRVDVEVRVGNHKAKSLKILVDLRLQLSPMLLKFFEVSLDALHRHGDCREIPNESVIVIPLDRKSVVMGKSVSVRVSLGGGG